MIEFIKTEIGYQKTIVNIDFLELKKGKFYALIGQNGIGKSTFLKTVLGLIKPLSGKVLISETPVQTIGLKERAKLISFVSTKFESIENLKVFDYIALGRSPYTNFTGKLSNEDLDKTQEVIGFLNIEKHINKFVDQLSDGEKQLVSIARAINQNTPIIVLDEPTSYLDYLNKTMVMSVLSKIVKEYQKCIILSSHDIELSLNKVDELILFHHSEKTVNKINVENVSFESIVKYCFNL